MFCALCSQSFYFAVVLFWTVIIVPTPHRIVLFHLLLGIGLERLRLVGLSAGMIDAHTTGSAVEIAAGLSALPASPIGPVCGAHLRASSPPVPRGRGRLL